MISGIHSRLRTPKIANPLHRFHTRCQVIRSNMQVHIGRETPRGTSNAVASQASRAADAVNERRLGERDPILTSEPCWRPPYRLFPDVIWIVVHTACVKARYRRPRPTYESRHVSYPPAVLQHAFQRARTEEKKRQRAAAIIEAARSLALERGVAWVTLTGVANRAGVHRSPLPASVSSPIRLRETTT